MTSEDQIWNLIMDLYDEDVTGPAFDRLVNIGEPAVDLLLEIFENELYLPFRPMVSSVLGKIGDKKALDPLLNIINDEDNRTRACVVKALGEIRDYRAIEPLKEALNDSDFKVRGNAVLGLGKISDAGSLDSILKSLNDKHYYVRENSAEALGLLGDKKAVIPLIDLFADVDGRVRGSAVVALGKIGEQSVDPLLDVLKDGDREKRFHAALALGKTHNVGSIEPLMIAREEEKDDLVIRGINSALNNLGSKKYDYPKKSEESPRIGFYLIEDQQSDEDKGKYKKKLRGESR